MSNLTSKDTDLNIENWKEDLAKFQSSEEGKAFFKQATHPPKKLFEPVKFTHVKHLAKLFLSNDELIDAIKKDYEWHVLVEKHGGIDDTDKEWQKKPHHAHNIIHNFIVWFITKTKCPYNTVPLRRAVRLAQKVMCKEIPSIESTEAILFMEKNYPYAIDFSEENNK